MISAGMQVDANNCGWQSDSDDDDAAAILRRLRLARRASHSNNRSRLRRCSSLSNGLSNGSAQRRSSSSGWVSGEEDSVELRTSMRLVPERIMPANDVHDAAWQSGEEDDRCAAMCSASLLRGPVAALTEDIDAMDVDLLPMNIDENTVRSIDEELRQVRSQKVHHTDSHDIAHQDVHEQAASIESQSSVYLIVDTNFLLSHLRWLSHFKNVAVQYDIALVIPWIVLQELDSLKNSNRPASCCSSSVGVLARQAIQCLRKWFEAADHSVLGQQMYDTIYSSSVFCNDDEILMAALHYRSQGYRVMILSNDNNLCVKALVHNVPYISKTTLPDPDAPSQLIQDILQLPHPHIEKALFAQVE